MKKSVTLKRLSFSLSWKATLMVCLGFFLVTTLPGCGGCRSSDQTAEEKKKEEEEKKKKQKKKEEEKEFTFFRPQAQPSGDISSRPLVKPGHWVTTSQQMQAHKANFNGQMYSAVTDRNDREIIFPKTPYFMTMSRPVSLPKGQTKHIESIFFVPRGQASQTNSLSLKTELRAKRGSDKFGAAPSSKIMPDYQYHFLVLSSTPDKYGYLKRLDSVSSPRGDQLDESNNNLLYYQVSLPKITKRVPLPSQPMTWSALAYILWDDVDPELLTPQQQRSLLDWLHWGGQIVVSGPSSLDLLKGSFLADYLPAQKVKSVELDQQAFNEINSYWSLADRKRNSRTLDVLADAPLLGVELKKHPLARALPNTGSLAIERRIGRGRIVVTAFSLTSPKVVNWPSYDGFFNACLLRRPGRQFSEPAGTLGVQAHWRQHPRLVKDARLVSTLRYFTRDIDILREETAAQVIPPWNKQREDDFGDMDDFGDKDAVEYRPSGGYGYDESPRSTISQAEMDPRSDSWHFGGYRPWAQSGVAGWNDNSGAANAAKNSLKDAAGITIPPPSFVLRMLAIYLVVLVPINWGIFRVIRRVEWAWVAAPIIAIIGAGVVIYSAQLNIGFARSRTEIIVLESYGGYNRAHVTRYTALYTSLSTSYELTFQDEASLVQPLAVDEQSRSRVERARSEVHFRRGAQPQFSGFKVSSNASDMLHSEQMIDLGKGFQIDGDQQRGFLLHNRTGMAVQDVGLLRRNEQGNLESAWVGLLAAGTSTPVTFSAASAEQMRLKQWNKSPVMSSMSERAGRFSLGGLVELACQRLQLAKGDIRMVGWSDEAIEGVTIRPRAAQSKFRTLVLIHLRGGELSRPQRDANCRADFDEKRAEEEEIEENADPFSEPKN